MKMSLKVFHTFIHGFLPYQLSRPIIHTTFRLTHVEHKNVSKDCAAYDQSHSKRHYLYSLKITLNKTISLSKRLGRINFNTVNYQSLAKGSTGTCLFSSNFWKKQVSGDNAYNRQNNY